MISVPPAFRLVFVDVTVACPAAWSVTVGVSRKPVPVIVILLPPEQTVVGATVATVGGASSWSETIWSVLHAAGAGLVIETG